MTMWSPNLVSDDTPRYVAIAEAIARDIDRGLLTEGARLPTHRDLARTLGVTVGTVTRGYAEAERRGLTVGEVGRGTFVRGRREPEDFGWRDAAHTPAESAECDLSLACPWVPPDGAEGRTLARTLQDIAAGHDLDELLMYNAGTALLRHRAIAADWISALGVPVGPEQVVVTNGAQHAMTVILATLLRPGDTLVTARLTYPGLKAVALMLGLRLHGVEMDDEGIVPEALEEACRTEAPRALYCVPTLQNPTSATMSEERRRAIAEVSDRHGLIVVEDEIHVAFHADRIPPIASFAPDRTLHITTLCKWATFGLRIGFVAAPERVVGRLRSGVRSSLWMPAPLMTEIATRWIADGTADRLGERKLEELAERHRHAREILPDHLEIKTDPRSLHLWIELPSPLRTDELVAQAHQRGVRIAGAEAFAVGRDVPHAVRVSLAVTRDRAELGRALGILAEILSGAVEPCVQIL